MLATAVKMMERLGRLLTPSMNGYVLPSSRSIPETSFKTCNKHAPIASQSEASGFD
jgi:hypothetical protein